MNPILVPVAQYLRMSTEHQQYSLQNQAERIKQYADEHNFGVIQTYSDAAKSGLVLRSRKGLQQLLKDVVSGAAGYRAILVYDVSRWGRFQDTDEAAHYEFLCRSAGIPVHYCAETFANDGSMPSLIMKALKRTMAGEYSRELGVKILAGQRRMAGLGFKQGGNPGYGLQRFLVSADGTLKQPLATGEHKSISSDRVILRPGRADEVQCVREIYRMLIDDKKSVYAIARELNGRGIPRVGGWKWDYGAVYTVLTHPKYAGHNVHGRTSQRLSTPTVPAPKADWTIAYGAFEALVDPVTFAEAQRILQTRTIAKSDDEVLDALRRVYAELGRLSYSIIQFSPDLPSPSTLRNRFGGLQQAFEMVGYSGSPGPISAKTRNRLQHIRIALMHEIVAASGDRICIASRGERLPTRLRMPSGRLVFVLMSYCFKPWKNTLRWRVSPRKAGRRLFTLLVRMDVENETIRDMFLLPRIGQRRTSFEDADSRLNCGVRLSNPSQLYSAVQQLGRTLASNDSRSGDTSSR